MKRVSDCYFWNFLIFRLGKMLSYLNSDSTDNYCALGLLFESKICNNNNNNNSSSCSSSIEIPLWHRWVLGEMSFDWIDFQAWDQIYKKIRINLDCEFAKIRPLQIKALHSIHQESVMYSFEPALHGRIWKRSFQMCQIKINGCFLKYSIFFTPRMPFKNERS